MSIKTLHFYGKEYIMGNGSKLLAVLASAVLCVGINPVPANAGIWDKINQATQSVQQVQSVGEKANQVGSALKKGSSGSSQGTSEGKPKRTSKSGSQNQFPLTETTNPIKGTWGDQVTCAGPNSATCQNGMDNLVNCMHQSKGYYFRLLAENLEKKLKDDYAEEDLVLLKEDIESVKAAIETGEVVDADPNERQRYLSWLNNEDQQELNAVNIKYINEVRDDCDKRFGGMSQFSH